jgi:hypothetical protein
VTVDNGDGTTSRFFEKSYNGSQDALAKAQQKANEYIAARNADADAANQAAKQANADALSKYQADYNVENAQAIASQHVANLGAAILPSIVNGAAMGGAVGSIHAGLDSIEAYRAGDISATEAATAALSGTVHAAAGGAMVSGLASTLTWGGASLAMHGYKTAGNLVGGAFLPLLLLYGGAKAHTQYCEARWQFLVAAAAGDEAEQVAIVERVTKASVEMLGLAGTQISISVLALKLLTLGAVAGGPVSLGVALGAASIGAIASWLCKKPFTNSGLWMSQRLVCPFFDRMGWFSPTPTDMTASEGAHSRPEITWAYRRLDLPPKSSLQQAEIDQHYRRKALIHHPDRQGGSDEAFRQTRRAYDEILVARRSRM